MRKTKRRRRGSGTAGIMIIVLAFLVVMTVQICRIRSKDAEYAAKEKELQIAKNMLKKGMNVSDIIEITGLTKEEVEKLV